MSVADAMGTVDTLDAVFASGFARLAPDQRDALAAIGRAFSGSPLGGPIAAAVEALSASEAAGHHLVALAAARSALLGAVADALLAESGAALAPAVPTESAPFPAGAVARLDGLRQWLVELALAGFAQLDAAALTPALPTLTALQTTPGMERLAALVTGFAHELLAHAPTSQLAQIPRRRWADLWCRALLGTVAPLEASPRREVRGALHVLGGDVRHHDQLVSVVVHGVLDAEGQRRFVRTTVSSWKVDAIAGPDVWNLLRPRAPALFAALAAPSVLEVSGACSATGELTIAAIGAATPYDPFSLDLAGVLYAAPPPRDRHPVQIAIPARDATDPLDLSRSGPLLDLADACQGAASILGLRRWDGGWRFQPLLVKTKKGVVGPGVTLALADKVKADARAVLTERAQKLLRAS